MLFLPDIYPQMFHFCNPIHLLFAEGHFLHFLQITEGRCLRKLMMNRTNMFLRMSRPSDLLRHHLQQEDRTDCVCWVSIRTQTIPVVWTLL